MKLRNIILESSYLKSWEISYLKLRDDSYVKLRDNISVKLGDNGYQKSMKVYSFRCFLVRCMLPIIKFDSTHTCTSIHIY